MTRNDLMQWKSVHFMKADEYFTKSYKVCNPAAGPGFHKFLQNSRITEIRRRADKHGTLLQLTGMSSLTNFDASRWPWLAYRPSWTPDQRHFLVVFRSLASAYLLPMLNIRRYLQDNEWNAWLQWEASCMQQKTNFKEGFLLLCE